MAVRLRLRRMGKKKQPIYKIVAADARSPRDGKFLEAVGIYNPLTNPHTIDLKIDKVNYWLDNGAEPTDTVKSLLSQKGVLLTRELNKRNLTEEEKQVELEKWAKLKEVKSSKVKKEKAQAKVEKTEENLESSTTEVKGAASEENPA